MKQLSFALFYLLIISFTSCKKDEYPAHQHASPSQIPSYKHAPAVPVDTNSVWGIMYISRTKAPTDTSKSKYIYDEWAWIYDSTHTAYIKLSSITFNNYNASGFCYWPANVPRPIYPVGLHHYYTGGSGGPCTDFKVDNGITWQVLSVDNTVSFNYNFSGHFPEYVGTVPNSVKASDGLTLTLDHATLPGVDSVQISITDDASHTFKRTYLANEGVINIGLIDFSGSNAVKIAFTMYAIKIETFNNKAYAFIKMSTSSRLIQLTQ